MGKIFKLLLFAAGVYLAVHLSGGRSVFEPNIADKLAPGNEVIMYSLTTCGYCKATRARLDRAGIPYTEYFLDTDPAKMREFDRLLAARSVWPGGIGTPTLVVNGALLLNNPSLRDIKQHLKYRS